MSGTEVYDEGNSLLVDDGWISALAGRFGLAERTGRRRMALVVEVAAGTLVGSVRVG